MKTQRRLISAVLLVSMLLSLFGGITSAAAAQAVTTVMTDSELAYTPLTQNASIAYEQHEDGYAVSLDRTADNVTMNITAVPGDGRSAEKARLYIRTGVTLKPNTAYRVSFSLWAENAQPEYAVCFDGGSAESAYGTLDGRGIEAGGTDQVKYEVTPAAENGELVLRLLLGKTGASGNTLRFSNLAVEEVSGSEVGSNVVLADHLNYNAPGFIRLWTNTDRKAVVTCDGKSATLSVIKGPVEGAEVWKIKLLAATGLKPEAGKTYHFRVDVDSNAKQSFELCYNEGDTEKGYGVEYSQRLTGQSQTLDYMIRIPKDKKNPGELIIQFSLGKLKTGDKVTISNIFIEEVSASYRSVLSDDFSFTDENTSVAEIDPIIHSVSSDNLSPGVNWLSTSFASKKDDEHHGNVSVLATSDGEAMLDIVDLDSKPESWLSKLYIQTGLTPEKGKSYRVSFDIRGETWETDWEVNFGKGGDNKDYGAIYSGDLPVILPVKSRVTYTISSLDDNGELWITLCLGKSLNTYWVSDVMIEELETVTTGDDCANVVYPLTSAEESSFEARGGHGSVTGNGSSVTMTCQESDPDKKYEKGLFVNDICRLEAGKSYLVSFSIKTNGQSFSYKAFYNKDEHFGGGHEGVFGERGGLPASANPETVTQVVSPENSGNLFMFLQFEDANEGTEVTVSGIQVQEIKSVKTTDPNMAGLTYPSNTNPEEDSGSFGVRDQLGGVTGDGNSVTMTCQDDNDKWKKGLIVKDICNLDAGKRYLVSFDIKTDNQSFTYHISYNKDTNFDQGNEGAFGKQRDLTASANLNTVTKVITPANDGMLLMFLEFTGADTGTKVTVSNIQVKEIKTFDFELGSSIAGVSYTTPSSGNAPPSPTNVFIRGYADPPLGTRGSLSGNGSSYVTMTCADYTDGETGRGLFVQDICPIKAGKSYQVSFDITSNADVDKYNVRFFSDSDKSEWDDEHAFRSEMGWKLSANQTENIKCTVTPDKDGDLFMRFDLGRVPQGKTVTVSNIAVHESELRIVSVKRINSFGSVWEEHAGDKGYTAELDRRSGRAVYTVTKPDGVTAEGYYAKLFIRTGVFYDPKKPCCVKFDITAENELKEFCVISQNVFPEDADIRGTWGLSIGAGETKTITTRTVTPGMGMGELILQIELGKLEGEENTFTISNVRVEEVRINREYRTELVCRGNSASLNVYDTPVPAMLEAWKVKMFVDTGLYACEGETYRVTFDTWAMRDFDYEVCYNRDDNEASYGALYDLHAAGNKETAVEHVFTASRDGKLILQLALGKISTSNVASVRNLRIERVSYSYSHKSALPAEPVYRTPSAVSYWAHEDYTTDFTGSDNSITANIKSAPAKGAEPWKIKLFLDTGVMLQAGRYYKVTANVKAKVSQDYEVCYNNGGIEMGYDSLGGLRLVSGETQTIERIISVPAGKTDLNNLTLQFNLGKTTVPNAVTVSGVKVEEASLSYVNMMAKDFAYTAGRTVNLWTNPDYTAKLEGAGSSAALHVTGVPSTGAEVWKVKLLVNTGAVLSAGKTYLVHADLLASKAQNYEVCFNNEETEKGFDALYNQTLLAGRTTVIEKKISVPDSMTDAGELILQFSVGGAAANDITVSNVSVQELNFGTGSGNSASDTVINLYNAPKTAAGTLDITREKLTYKMTKISSAAKDNAITIAGADLRSGDLYTVAFTARADKDLTGTFALNPAGGGSAVISQQFRLTAKETKYSFTTKERLPEGGFYDLLWQFGSADNQKAGSADVEISNISVYSPPEKLEITRGKQNVTVNGKMVTPDTYNINGNNYIKLRDLALLLNDTDGQFVVRYNAKTKLISLTTGKPYTPVGGELTAGEDRSATCVRSPVNITVNGKKVNLKAYNLGRNNFFRLRDLSELLGFRVDYVAESNSAAITSPLTPEAQEKAHDYDIFFLPEVDGEAQPYVGDTMPYYENGVYYIYYLKDGGDSYNHSVYVATTKDFVKYTEHDNPVLSASREDVQDSWIGTGSVVKVEDAYYFFYTGFNASGSHEYHEKIMVAKGSSPTSFEKVSGWEIIPPAELGQKNDFRDPQAYYDPASKTISLTVTTTQDGKARIVKYTLGKDLQSVKYDGIIYTDPTGEFWNLECSDTFQMGNKWYLTYSGQEDTLWYAMADSRFGPYTNPARLEGKLFYAAKHVEDGKNTYMVGWARRANSASSTQEVNGWAGNLAVQKLYQQEDGKLALVPVDSIVAGFDTQKELALGASQASLTAGSNYSYKAAFTSYESFMLSGEFTYSGTGSFGLAFDFNGKEEQYKLISLEPAAGKLSLSFNEGTTPITETQAALRPNQTHSFTYIQDGSVGIFYLDNQAALLVRLYGVTNKPIYLFAENNSVTFTSLRQCTQ